MLTQLVGLCGMDKWKEAEQYFPKVHRAITKNGKYNVPTPLTYIQKCLTERGYKATAPAYAKTTTTATAKEPTNAQMVEFFINRGIEIYKVKQVQKKEGRNVPTDDDVGGSTETSAEKIRIAPEKLYPAYSRSWVEFSISWVAYFWHQIAASLVEECSNTFGISLA